MIKIPLTLIVKEEIKERHLNKIKKSKFFKTFKKKVNESNNLQNILKNEIKKLLDSSFCSKILNDLEELRDNPNSECKGILEIFVAEKDRLEEMKEKMFLGDKVKYGKIKLKKEKDRDKQERDLIEFFELFLGAYKSFRSSWSDWNGTKYSELLEIRTCPYCNSSYIYKYSGNKECKTTAELDHYYSKIDYPFLAISIFNLIPCCHNCNHIKSNEDKEILYPFKESASIDMQFRVKDTEEFINSMTNLKSTIESIEIELINRASGSKKIKIDNHIEVFKLKSRYNNHKSETNDVINKVKMFTPERIEEYSNIFSISEKEVKEIIFGITLDEDEEKNKILSKFTKDIKKQFI